MDDPFIYGLLFLLLLIFLTLKSAFSSINQLQLELDKTKLNYHTRILNFISKRPAEFSVVINICFYLVLIAFILILRNDCISFLTFKHFSIFNAVFLILIGILFFPGLIILPKTFGEYFSNEIVNFSAIPIIIIYTLLYPFTKLILLLSNAPVELIYKERINENPRIDFNKEDLNKLVQDSQKHMTEDDEIDNEVKLFKNALEFSEVKIRECMVPRNEITAIEVDDIENDLKSKFIETGYSRILIYKDNIENIIGFIKSKSLFFSNSDFKNNLKRINYFPESMQANKLLRHFIKAGENIAVVVDEFGGTSGIITIEDILEEIFGEIQDEHDTEDLFEKKLAEDDFVFSGRLEIDYINDKYHINIPENEEYETIAGFILHHTESLPKSNDEILINPFKIRVLKVSDTRLELIKLEIISDQS